MQLACQNPTQTHLIHRDSLHRTSSIHPRETDENKPSSKHRSCAWRPFALLLRPQPCPMACAAEAAEPHSTAGDAPNPGKSSDPRTTALSQCSPLPQAPVGLFCCEIRPPLQEHHTCQLHACVWQGSRCLQYYCLVLPLSFARAARSAAVVASILSSSSHMICTSTAAQHSIA